MYDGNDLRDGIESHEIDIFSHDSEIDTEELREFDELACKKVSGIIESNPEVDDFDLSADNIVDIEFHAYSRTKHESSPDIRFTIWMRDIRPVGYQCYTEVGPYNVYVDFRPH